MEEKWKALKTIKGNYFISNFGELKKESKSGLITLKGGVDTGGYCYHMIDNKYISKQRLVAINFIPNPENKPQVNHIDGNKKNNRIDYGSVC